MKNDLTTPDELAKLTGLSSDYIRKLIHSGKIKAEKLGRFWIMDKKTLAGLSRKRKRRCNNNHKEDEKCRTKL